MRLAQVIALACESGDATYLNAIAQAFAAELPDKPALVRNAMLYTRLATSTTFDAETMTFSGDPVLGNVEISTGELCLTIGGKNYVATWSNITDVLAIARKAEKQQSASKTDADKVDFAKSVKSTANKVRKSNPIGATLLDVIAGMSSRAMPAVRAYCAYCAVYCAVPCCKGNNSALSQVTVFAEHSNNNLSIVSIVTYSRRIYAYAQHFAPSVPSTTKRTRYTVFVHHPPEKGNNRHNTS